MQPTGFKPFFTVLALLLLYIQVSSGMSNNCEACVKVCDVELHKLYPDPSKIRIDEAANWIKDVLCKVPPLPEYLNFCAAASNPAVRHNLCEQYGIHGDGRTACANTVDVSGVDKFC
ncbi:hypothetical protein DdX_13144 [Ditylenchus destructor]|uniref:Saposin B-type domain-containing protein n=1 Tax=Ditylenchus destructor TaxID=166010 RepID=A0AAD4MX49_9BILA|nr:hypothetical protein DdX_13144 [Ditylenchus destructor]